MKGNCMRVMRVFDIEKNYQQHKRKLMSIQTLNTKRKVSSYTLKNVQTVNSFKKQRLNAEIFSQKEKLNKIQQQNGLLHRNLTKVYSRQTPKKRLNSAESRTSIRSLCTSQSKIRTQNTKIRQKISNTKSFYEQIRLKQQKKQKKPPREELVRLLEQQLGLKPKVMFPHVRKNPKSDYSVPFCFRRKGKDWK